MNISFGPVSRASERPGCQKYGDHAPHAGIFRKATVTTRFRYYDNRV
jgi:hypothetical protein